MEINKIISIYATQVITNVLVPFTFANIDYHDQSSLTAINLKDKNIKVENGSIIDYGMRSIGVHGVED